MEEKAHRPPVVPSLAHEPSSRQGDHRFRWENNPLGRCSRGRAQMAAVPPADWRSTWLRHDVSGHREGRIERRGRGRDGVAASHVPPRSRQGARLCCFFFFFFFTLVTGPIRSSSLKLSDTRVCAPQIRARLGTTAHFCEVLLPGPSTPWGPHSSEMLSSEERESLLNL